MLFTSETQCHEVQRRWCLSSTLSCGIAVEYAFAISRDSIESRTMTVCLPRLCFSATFSHSLRWAINFAKNGYIFRFERDFLLMPSIRLTLCCSVLLRNQEKYQYRSTASHCTLLLIHILFILFLQQQRKDKFVFEVRTDWLRVACRATTTKLFIHFSMPTTRRSRKKNIRTKYFVGCLSNRIFASLTKWSTVDRNNFAAFVVFHSSGFAWISHRCFGCHRNAHNRVTFLAQEHFYTHPFVLLWTFFLIFFYLFLPFEILYFFGKSSFLFVLPFFRWVFSSCSKCLRTSATASFQFCVKLQ